LKRKKLDEKSLKNISEEKIIWSQYT